MMYRNSEGYADPTAGAAMGNVMREYRKNQRELWRCKAEITGRPKVYVVSRYAGEIAKNVENARKYCRFVTQQKCIPIASHLLYPQFLNDSDSKERELGTMFGLALLAQCNEVWCFGTFKSAGMTQELHEANRLKKPIRFFTAELEEI